MIQLALLVLYPTLIEPALTLSTQTRVWSIGYSVAVAMTLVCAMTMTSLGSIFRPGPKFKSSATASMLPSGASQWDKWMPSYMSPRFMHRT